MVYDQIWDEPALWNVHCFSGPPVCPAGRGRPSGLWEEGADKQQVNFEMTKGGDRKRCICPTPPIRKAPSACAGFAGWASAWLLDLASWGGQGLCASPPDYCYHPVIYHAVTSQE